MNWQAVKHRLDLYEKLMRLDKPIGILLLLWPTLWALWIASHGQPDGLLVWIFSLGTVLMRSAGCVINDYADQDFDRHVERTKDRPLTAGKIGSKEALALAGGLAVLSFLLILPLNTLVWLLSVGALFVAASYPFTKRFFAIPQAYLGIAFGFGIPMAFAAVQERVPVEAWLMLLANIFWAIAYDTAYAMVDRNDDLKIGIKTSAVTFGRFEVSAIMICYVLTFSLLAYVGHRVHLGWGWYGGLLAACGLAGYHYTLIRTRERGPCFKAFLHNNWVGAVIFVGLVVDYWI
ncbi:4-hydroxybenzoate octaprenyltransferase [Denitratisoma sp. agr-D3]